MNVHLQGAKKIAIFFGILVYVGVSVYADIMFYRYVSHVFPSGFLSVVSLIGVFATGISVCALLFAKFVWFSPGLQTIIAWIFWGVEICILGLNAVLGFQVGDGRMDAVLTNWAFVAPASPLVALVFWGILFLVDPSHKLRQAGEELRAVQLEIYTKELIKQARSVNIQDALLYGAMLSAREMAEGITGLRLFQDEKRDNQLENLIVGDNQVEKGTQYTHNLPQTKPWGGSRNGSGRKKEEES